MTTQGTHSLLDLASDLREKADHVQSFWDHKQAAETMVKAAAALERLAHLDPEIEVVHGEN